MNQDTTLKAQRKRAAKPMLWIGIASMAMAFVGLTSGYFVSKSTLEAKNAWLTFDIPANFYYSTAVMLVSSVLMIFAVRAARKAKMSQVTLYVLSALVLGVTFALLQWYGWGQMLDNQVYFTGANSNLAGSWFYVITGFHLLHVVAGLIVLLVTVIKSQIGIYTKNDYQGVEMAAIFWHFVDILWIYLFLFLAIIR